MDVTPPTARARLLRFLVLALAVPLALLGAAAAQQISEHRNAAAAADRVRLETALQGLVHELQKERGLAAGYVGGVRQFGPQWLAQRRATDTARARLARALRGRDDACATALRAVLRRLDGLTEIRRRVDDGTGAVRETVAFFSTGITGLDRIGPGFDEVSDGQLRAVGQALQTLGRAKEFTDEERAVVLGAAHAGHFPGDDYSRFLQLRAARLAALDSFPRSATSIQRRRLDAALGTPDAERALAYESVALRTEGRLAVHGVPPLAWWESTTSLDDGLRAVQISLGADAQQRSAALESAARRELLLFMLFALGTVATLGHLALACVRSVPTPLAALVQQAREAAGIRLPRTVAAVPDGTAVEYPGPPAPLVVPDRAAAEVLDVATAFDRVQRVAFDLATEQVLPRRSATAAPRADEAGPARPVLPAPRAAVGEYYRDTSVRDLTHPSERRPPRRRPYSPA